jgi:hypothetical protein
MKNLFQQQARDRTSFHCLLTAFSCIFLFGCGTTGSSPSGGPVDNAISSISRNRNKAEDSAATIKRKYKESSPQYVKAQRLYRDAKAENNSWLDLLQYKIRNGVKPEKSPDFTAQSEKAGTAAENFLKYADSPDVSVGEAAVPLVTGVPWVDLGKLLIDSGISIWKVYGEQQQATRERNAKELEKLRWDSWDGAKAKPEESQEKPKPDKAKDKEKPADKAKPEAKPTPNSG